MAAISLFWYTNMAAVTSDENDLLEMNNRVMARQERIPLGEYRKRVLLAAAERHMDTITIRKFNAWFTHMQTYLPRCLNGNFIEG